MKRGFSVFGAGMVMAAAVSVQAMGSKIPSKTGDYCKDEAIRLLERTFPGLTVDGKDIKKLGGGTTWSFWAKTDLCAGYFVFDYGNEHFMCTSAQYGRPAFFLKRMWAQGDCKAHLPEDVYP